MAFTNIATVSVGDWDWTSMTKTYSFETKETQFSVSEDIIALSCVARRLGRHLSIIESADTLAKSITAEDRFTAQNIRKHYNGKLMIAQLKGEGLSEFRQDLVKLLNTPMNEKGEYVYSDKFAGMIYKLPYFYEYDRTLIDDVFGSEYHEILNPIKLSHNNKATVKLSYIRKLDAFRKRVPQTEYWFTDKNDNRVLLSIDKANPLDALFDHYIQDNDIVIEGYYSRDHKDTLNFYKVKFWNPVF